MTEDKGSSVANTHSLIQNNHMWPHSLVDGVLQVLLQPPDLWVQTHLLVCLQLGTSQKKEKRVQLRASVLPQLKMKGWITQSQTPDISTPCYQTD